MNWKKYGFEFLSIFIAVIAAFALNNWNDNRRDRNTENKILIEISKGLKKDFEDVKLNVLGHKQGLKAITFFKESLTRKDTVSNDLFLSNYFILTRDFFSVQNTSGYEVLKSKGLELIKNDSLRSKIISLYENDYSVLRKFEEEYMETQFHENYFQEINQIIAPNFEFDESKTLERVRLPLEMSEKDEKIFLIDLWKIKVNREQVLFFYSEVEGKIDELNKEIEEELKH
jgi:hypothetical protein